MEKHHVTIQEASIKSNETKAINISNKEKAVRKAKLSTAEGKAAALAFIFGTK